MVGGGLVVGQPHSRGLCVASLRLSCLLPVQHGQLGLRLLVQHWSGMQKLLLSLSVIVLGASVISYLLLAVRFSLSILSVKYFLGIVCMEVLVGEYQQG